MIQTGGSGYDRTMTRKVLLVEDDPTNATLMEVILGHEGFSITTRNRAEDALATAQQEDHDLFVVDLELSGSSFDGIEVIRRLKAIPRTSKVPIIACTAALLQFEGSHARQAGADAFLSKPYTVDQICQLIKRLLPA